MEYPAYFVHRTSRQFVKLESATAGIILSIYYSTITGSFQYSLKTCEPLLLETLQKPEADRIYKNTEAGDWNLAKGQFLNWVKSEIPKLQTA